MPDKIDGRRHDKIDTFMGGNIEAARRWGIKKDIQIAWSRPR